MHQKSRGRDLFIVDNSMSGWTALRYLEEWTGIAKGFDIATGNFEIGAQAAPLSVLRAAASSNGAMNDTRSPTQGGRSSALSSLSRRPAQRASTSSRLPSPMRGKIRQLVFSSGRAQTDPTHALSCQGTRIVMWCVGS
jgi:hypothetical protein